MEVASQFYHDDRPFSICYCCLFVLVFDIKALSSLAVKFYHDPPASTETNDHSPRFRLVCFHIL